MDNSETKKPWIETPLIWSRTLSKAAGCNVFLKLENTQPSGAFKSRGIGHYMQQRLPKSNSQANGHTESVTSTHFFCSSGGNAGLACVHAAATLGCPSTIVVPMTTNAYMIGKLRDAGAKEVIQIGASWFEADQHLVNELLPKAKTSGESAVYVPPFDHPDIWTGNATMVEEIVKQLPVAERSYPVKPTSASSKETAPDAIVCSVGGGGLFCGVMQGLSTCAPTSKTKVLAVETVGADSLAQAVQKRELVTLPAITSIATTLGARTVARQAFAYASKSEKVCTAVLTDAEAVDACLRFADDERMLVEPSCGVSLAACYTGKVKQYLPDLNVDSRVVIVVCGGSNASLQGLADYKRQFSD
ncbi:serine family amino acid catabolism-related [Lecanosticta acicola]|uniref:L-serine ammonia-lyase n=1 Tax=Lecanosticta acicola TaxID=111012 RepID=A0AAI8YUW4_9PEZI|nr:serine family amino acid catabolism-related [Lecanosticta acicola]